MSTESAVPQEDTRLRHRLPRVAGSAVERARLTVVPRVPRLRSRAPRVPFVALVSVLLLAGVVGLLLFNTSMQQASFEATRLERQAATLSAQQQTLAVQIDQLRDPQQLAVRAQRQGLVPPSTVAFLDVETGEVTGDPTPASPDGALRLQAPPPVRPAELDPAPIVEPVPTRSDVARSDRQPNRDQGRGGSRGQAESRGQGAAGSTAPTTDGAR